MKLSDPLISAITELCNQGVAKQIAIGALVSTWMSIEGVKHGEKMKCYDAIAEIVYQNTGEKVTGDTIRKWKHAADLVEEVGNHYAAMPYAVFIEAVNLASPCQFDPTYILDWAMDHMPVTVPQLRAHFLPQTSAGMYAPPDHPAVMSMLRAFRKLLPEGDPRWAIAQPLIDGLRKLLNEIQTKEG